MNKKTCGKSFYNKTLKKYGNNKLYNYNNFPDFIQKNYNSDFYNENNNNNVKRETEIIMMLQNDSDHNFNEGTYIF